MRRFNSFTELKECFENLINSHSSDLGLAPNEILSGSHKAKAPYISIQYRPTNETIHSGSNFHKMEINVVIAIEYSKDFDLLDLALKKAGVIELICLQNNFTYAGHQEGYTLDMLENKKQTDYFLIAECSAYYRNV